FGPRAGGGLAIYYGDTAVLTNCTISGNSTNFFGGALNNSGATAMLTNCTVSANTAPYTGGMSNYGTATLNNTIVAGNAGGDLFGRPTTGSNDLIGGDPVLAPLGNYGGPTQTMPELPGSPAIGAGSVALALDPQGHPLTADQRGLPRLTN